MVYSTLALAGPATSGPSIDSSRWACGDYRRVRPGVNGCASITPTYPLAIWKLPRISLGLEFDQYAVFKCCGGGRKSHF